NEEIVGKALAGRRDQVVLATKFHGRMGEGRNRSGNSRRWIMQEVDASLRRLGTDWIDIYQVHRPEPGTDIDETLAALSDLIHAGKIRYAGSSTFPAEEIVEAQWTAERRGRASFVCAKPPHSLLTRQSGRAALPARARHGMGVMAWSPLGGGWLTGRYRKGQDVDMTKGRASRIPARFDPKVPGNQRKLDVVEQLLKVAADAGCSLVHLAHAFVLAHPAVTS